MVGCGTSHAPAPPATLPAGSIAGLTSRERVLPASVLTAEALDHAGMARLLKRVNYIAGSEREFYGRSRPLSHVTARSLLFVDPRNAAAYLAWATRHTVETVGNLRSTRRLTVGDGGIMVRARGCGCHGEAPTFLALWRHGSIVFSILASGQGADDKRVAGLTIRLDVLARPA